MVQGREREGQEVMEGKGGGERKGKRRRKERNEEYEDGAEETPIQVQSTSNLHVPNFEFELHQTLPAKAWRGRQSILGRRVKADSLTKGKSHKPELSQEDQTSRDEGTHFPTGKDCRGNQAGQCTLVMLPPSRCSQSSKQCHERQFRVLAPIC